MIDSSPPSPESSFRELDEVFLQTQTRIWLGEVLDTRLDEGLLLSDLLQDGEILFDVSKLVWDLLLAKCMELRHLKHKYWTFGSKRSIGRYRPYSNVDSFLKICKILGLGGIDLFSPSDVVEKRDIRKICICIRALSKKARSKQLSVPDFDMVTYSVAMPKSMVGLIRQGLESSHCTLSSSSSYSPPNVSQKKLKKKNLQTPSKREKDYISSSDESDEAESRYMGDFDDGVSSKLEISPEGNGSKHMHHESASLPENVGSISQQQLENDRDYSVVGDSDGNYISDYLAFSDLMVQATEGCNSVTHDGENNMFDFFLSVDSKCPTSSKRSSGMKFSDDEDVEVSSTTSMSSVLGRLLNMEFDEQFDEAGKHCKDSLLLSREAQQEVAYNGELELCDLKTGNPETENEGNVLFNKNEDNVASNHVSTDIVSCHMTHISDCLESSCDSISDIGCLASNVEDGPQECTSSADNKKDNSVSTGKKDSSLRLPPGLRTVVKGTAIAGVLFLLLHVSGKIKGSNGDNARGNKQHGQVLKSSHAKSSSAKRRTESVGKRVYPAEKIKL